MPTSRLRGLVLLFWGLWCSHGCLRQYVVAASEATAAESTTGGAGSRCPGAHKRWCDGGCVDIWRDRDHCGGCSRTCEPGGWCKKGECTAVCDQDCDALTERCYADICECRPGFSRCGDVCADLVRDAEHCGSCEVECLDDPCGDGRCLAQGCGAFDDQCGDSCTFFANDPLNCGDCGNTCASDQLCTSARCIDADVELCDMCPCARCDDLCCEWSVEGATLCLEASSCP